MTKSNHVMAIGRMNPPTLEGHGALVNKVKSEAAKTGSGHTIFLTGSHDKKKNPLPLASKLKYASTSFPDTNIQHGISPIHALKSLNGKHHSITFVAGSDRVPEMQTLVNKYNGPKGEYHFPGGIKVVSAGHRDPDAEGTSGMSASKLRGHAAAGNFDEFKKHVHPKIAKPMYDELRKNMDIKEALVLTYSQMRVNLMESSAHVY